MIHIEKMIECPKCHGEGVFRVFRSKHPIFPCHFCDGTKRVPSIHLTWIKEGELLKDRRIQKRLTLRKAAKLLRMNLRDLSDMEIGKRSPDLSITYDRIKIIKTDDR